MDPLPSPALPRGVVGHRRRRLLPVSGSLHRTAFDLRRRVLAGAAIAHVPALLALGLAAGLPLGRALAVAAPVPVLAVVGASLRRRRPAAMTLATALGWCAVALVHLTHGSAAAQAEAVVVVAAIATLHERAALGWVVGALTAAAGAAHVLGPLVAPGLGLAAGGRAEPWPWAGLEALVLIAAALPSVAGWRAVEAARDEADDLAADAQQAKELAHRHRAHVDLLMSLARRNQALVQQQLEELDVLELDEADPDALAGLFRLDHLATRMRRNAESLLALSGDEPRRWHGGAVSLSEVVRAAVGEVEDYVRVEVVLAEDPLVAGTASNDLAHLLAELVENATRFSPRSTLVVVSGQSTPGGYELRVKDRGPGMTEQARHERNRQLAAPRDDLELTSVLGLHVCSCLARRLGVRVELQPNGNGGTTAAVGLPAGLLTEQVVPRRPLLAAALAALGPDDDEVPDEEGPEEGARTGPGASRLSLAPVALEAR